MTAMPESLARENGYLLCASPRSGSTLLCDLLAQTGVAGVPNSFFRPASISGFARLWGVPLEGHNWDSHYVHAAVRAGTGDTGCFGMRIMWTDMPALLAQLSALYPNPDDGPTRLASAFGITRFIHLSRDDRVAQAVSLVMARQTGLWHLNADGSERQRSAPPASPHYDGAMIAEELRNLRDEAAGWRTWFDATGIEPLMLTYEQLAEDPVAGLERVTDYLGAAGPKPVEPRTARLATERNNEWMARFRAGN